MLISFSGRCWVAFFLLSFAFCVCEVWHSQSENFNGWRFNHICNRQNAIHSYPNPSAEIMAKKPSPKTLSNHLNCNLLNITRFDKSARARTHTSKSVECESERASAWLFHFVNQFFKLFNGKSVNPKWKWSMWLTAYAHISSQMNNIHFCCMFIWFFCFSFRRGKIWRKWKISHIYIINYAILLLLSPSKKYISSKLSAEKELLQKPFGWLTLILGWHFKMETNSKFPSFSFKYFSASGITLRQRQRDTWKLIEFYFIVISISFAEGDEMRCKTIKHMLASCWILCCTIQVQFSSGRCKLMAFTSE